ncbi:MAG: hypothetical protein M1813_001618 [Trichoglossum hirsutum]|nr:MAG: hypothetical protein M1813_001618 [Trichoglossum hirsutum]
MEMPLEERYAVSSVAAALSMVNYFNSTNPANTTHPDLRTYVTIRVWKYGLSSAAPKIAAATLLLGCVTVLIRLYFLLTSYETQPSVPDIIVAISELQSSDVLQGVPKDERQHVRVVIGSSNASGRVSIRAFGMGPYS